MSYPNPVPVLDVDEGTVVAVLGPSQYEQWSWIRTQNGWLTHQMTCLKVDAPEGVLTRFQLMLMSKRST